MQGKLAYKTQSGKAAVLDFYDSMLEQWPISYESLNVSTRFGNTFIIACGRKDAPPLILLHGSGMNSCMWIEDARVYSHSYRVYAVDILGEAGRSDETQVSLTNSSYSDWLSDVFNSLSVEKAEVIGISLGAWIAIKFSTSYPEKVNRLVLLSPLGISPQRKSFLFTFLIHMLSGKGGMYKLYNKINSNPFIPEWMQRYQRLIGDNFNSRNELIPLFSDVEIKRLTMPTMVFVGEKDIIIDSNRTVKCLKNLLPQVETSIMAKVGHTLVNIADHVTSDIRRVDRK